MNVYLREKVKNLAVATAMLLLLSPIAVSAQNREEGSPEFEDTVSVPMSAVPRAVLNTAQKAKPGMYITGIERELAPDDNLYYLFEGSLVNTYWEIKVRADGVLMQVSEEGEPPQGSD